MTVPRPPRSEGDRDASPGRRASPSGGARSAAEPRLRPLAAPIVGSDRSHLATDLPWWHFGSAARLLAAFAAGLTGRRRFGLRLATTGVNFCDFEKHAIVIDPEVVTDPDPAVHLALTKGAICHEAGHVLFTTPFFGLDTRRTDGKGGLLARVTNVLEDERIERAMMETHWGTAKYLRFRKREMWKQVLRECDAASDDPAEVMTALLALRYGWSLKGELSPVNVERLACVRPLAVAAWTAVDTETVVRIAEEIIRILGLEDATDDQTDRLPPATCRLSLGAPRDDDADPGPGGTTLSILGLDQRPGDPSGGGGSGAASGGDESGEPTDERGAAGDGGEGDEPDGDAAAGSEAADDAAEAEDGAEAAQAGTGSDATDDPAMSGDDADAASGGDAQSPGSGSASGSAATGRPGDARDSAGGSDATPGAGGDDEPAEFEPADDTEVAALLADEGDELARALGGASHTAGRSAPGLVADLAPAAVEPALGDRARRRGGVLARRLRESPTRPRSVAAVAGGRYSFRDQVRSADRSFRRRSAPTTRRTVALGALVDCSGSMGRSIAEVAEALLATHRAASEAAIAFGVWAFSDWDPPAVPIVDPLRSTPTDPERIRGLRAAGGTMLAPALLAAADQIARVPADRRVLLVLHDGSPTDVEASSVALRRLARRMDVVGIWVGPEDESTERMRILFGRRLVVASDVDALMTVLGAFLVRLVRPPSV